MINLNYQIINSSLQPFYSLLSRQPKQGNFGERSCYYILPDDLTANRKSEELLVGLIDGLFYSDSQSYYI